jgi:hypothetical protein
MSSDTSRERELALSSALEFARDRADIGYADLVAGADKIYRWLIGPVFIRSRFSVVRAQGSEPTGQEGPEVPQIKDDQEFDWIIDEFDTKGVEVGDRPDDTTDDPTFTVDVEGALLLTVDPENPRKVTIGGANQTGSFVVTCDPHIFGFAPLTKAVDVVAGDAATATSTESEVRPQTPASQG